MWQGFGCEAGAPAGGAPGVPEHQARAAGV